VPGFGLYLHVPFCRHKCPYCDFYTYPFSFPETAERYVDALTAELRRAEETGFAGRRADTIFFGGGTPSLLTPPQLTRLFEAIRAAFDVAPGAETTLEINPEDVTAETAGVWKGLGVNRASVGVQSFDPSELARLERQHGPEGAERAVRLLRDAGFANVSLDLMFGLAEQDWPKLRASIERAIHLEPDHVSAYSLTVEEKTRFAVDLKQGQLTLPAEEAQVDLFLRVREFLADAGYAPYEISNFTKPGFASRHNLTYWTGGEYLGIGASAHSFRKDGGAFKRRWNVPSLPKYTSALLKEGRLPFEKETLTAATHWGERLMTGLRLTAGVDLAALEADLGPPPPHVAPALRRFSVSGHLAFEPPGRYHLTDVGLPLANEIFRELVS
jgi:oxygen-independent coproporphyrinogen-3 oxidase